MLRVLFPRVFPLASHAKKLARNPSLRPMGTRWEELVRGFSGECSPSTRTCRFALPGASKTA
ncbi:MAG: hypothetical protein ACI88C_003172 [Acidimicrobiales bacterium]|jgi:hypothetical protein